MMGITLTGADERTSLADLAQLADLGAEIGLLYTFSPDGRNRYPSPEWITRIVLNLRRKVAIHICGQRARQQLYDGSIDYLVEDAGRIQVNGHLEAAWLCRVCQRYGSQQIITQHNAKNVWLLPVEAPNHAVLVDASGGRGELPEYWGRPNTDKPVGFAGGLGPSTLRENLPMIAAVADGHPNGWWIDMEGQLRVLRDGGDWFDVRRALAVMDIWDSWRNRKVEPMR